MNWWNLLRIGECTLKNIVGKFLDYAIFRGDSVEFYIYIYIYIYIYMYCDAPNPGCPLTTRQPAEFYESHVMKPIHVQKWPLGPTHHTHKNVDFIQK